MNELQQKTQIPVLHAANQTTQADKPFLDIRQSVGDLRKMYDDSSASKYVRLILFGDIGVGKTKFLETCPRPIHVDEFDQGGTKSIRGAINEGWIVADTRFENEDPRNPSVLELYDKTYVQRKREGYFDYFGTYCLDGFRMFFASGMNAILKRRKRGDWIPEVGRGKDNDYVASQALIEPIIRDILNLPCNVVITCHLDLSVDETNPNKTFIGPQISGQLQGRLMSIVDEVWCLQMRNTKDGYERSILTQPNGLYRCRSRLAANGKIDTFEKPDFKRLLRLGGMSDVDKPIKWLEDKT